MKLIILLFIFPIFCFGQISITGKVINKRTKEAIAFATVGLVKENIGTNAVEDGSFHLQSIKPILNDTLIISCLGFVRVKLPTVNLSKGNNIIELDEHQITLDEVSVKSRSSWTYETLNNFSNCGNHFITSGGYQTQIAQHLIALEENSVLTEVKICRMSSFIIDPEKTIFRIRIYDIDSLTKLPSSDLCDQIIEVKTRSKTVTVNLEKYKIRIPNKDFFVAVEWLKIPYNESKSTIKINGKETEHTTYRPSIGWTDKPNPQIEAWMLDYKNIWRRMFKSTLRTSVSISATVKY
ncbi:MAG TPA: carboxypeptidase-like regulatory domain-containing protein [Sediminibacterium sp.]|uniref:carboxypeptidase-like regulatory domain-containing protein n=1 Tax=Sediminibacterium sp. TaxID=1917865 RepID=UPI0008D088BB|nr:carboxypeptidase-like regulatory domain-containing protein [Sediminibacterium sp.]OHC84797.1 MAG: hypothetical protein A2472_14035 [Sphingobacteriia bacterium RIFOXYC2_FULL_35_18]OHC88168.1 MAG: hypothetical protein A2546_00805 [Sphingobacteriia bacterium RIFOXYD2_FULL_35_12]HLD53314.1 carboxypeptidase-like regulatory domain-containing protein [Sediminibacterium sp.]